MVNLESMDLSLVPAVDLARIFPRAKVVLYCTVLTVLYCTVLY